MSRVFLQNRYDESVCMKKKKNEKRKNEIDLYKELNEASFKHSLERLMTFFSSSKDSNR
jgi:hypothetical protein